MRRVVGRLGSVGAAAPPPTPAPSSPAALRQIGIGVSVVLISAALIALASRLFARPVYREDLK